MGDADAAKVVAALQIQVNRDFAPVWGIDAAVRYVGLKEKPLPTEWALVILDNSDQADALGYHDLTKAGLPIGKIFAKTDFQYGEQWSVTASHELLEMLADPAINLSVMVEGKDGSIKLFGYEVCDACEADKLAYKIGDVLVSDFVTPAWFETFRKTGPFDFQNKIKKPFGLLPGGYIGLYVVGSGWTQITAEKVNMRARPPVGSRRERRTLLPSKFIVSTAD